MAPLYSIANRAFEMLGYTLERRRPADPFAYLPDIGDIRTIIDIGVARGTPGLYDAFPEAYLILIEPNPTFHPWIRNRLLTERTGELHPVAAGSRADRLTLTLAGTKSSLLARSQLTMTGKLHETRDVDVKRLDDILVPERLSRPAFLKVDTEGYELEAVRGLGGLRTCIDYIALEASVVERFQNSYSFVQLIREMDDLGYCLTRVLAAPRDPDGLIKYTDLLFSRDPF